MPTSRKKIAANRQNGSKSRGPINTTSTRFNATKHGLLAVGLTELDDTERYRTILGDLIREKKPVGTLEIVLVESLAVDTMKWQRAKRLEAEYITGELNPPTYGPNMVEILGLDQGQMLDPGLPASISAESAQRLVCTFQRYESVIANRLFRTLHELERLQRSRMGEQLPAPVAVDVNIHAPARAADSADGGIVDLASTETGAVGSAPKAT